MLIDKTFFLAFEHHKKNNFVEAEKLYSEILDLSIQYVFLLPFFKFNRFFPKVDIIICLFIF